MKRRASNSAAKADHRARASAKAPVQENRPENRLGVVIFRSPAHTEASADEISAPHSSQTLDVHRPRA